MIVQRIKNIQEAEIKIEKIIKKNKNLEERIKTLLDMIAEKSIDNLNQMDIIKKSLNLQDLYKKTYKRKTLASLKNLVDLLILVRLIIIIL